jgi:hypothetical protein
MAEYRKSWQDSICKNGKPGNKLRCYNIFKHDFLYEPYLSNITNKTERVLFTKLRVSNHKLQIELGRYHKPKKIPAEKRFCTVCNNNHVENEFHFLMDCKGYEKMRETFVSEITEIVPEYIDMSSENQFNFIMRGGEGESDICCIIGSFVHKCFEMRKEFS